MAAGSGSGSDHRRKAYKLGLSAENRAALALRLTGWRILKRRFKTGSGEIDLIAKRGNTVAFIEVKARRNRESALDAVTPTAQRRIVKAARIFIAGHPKAVFYTLRFDVMIVRPWRWPEHIVNAFQARD
ncbi:YraN family protein [Roseibium sp.]|uniref:YraN family protein n=1 Tax=Roseibium sp. TaxID=1936156 RepID=UPI003A96FAF3